MTKNPLLTGIALSAMAMLTSCGGGQVDPTPIAAAPPPPPVAVTPPPPPPAQTGLSLTRCLAQTVGGRSVQDIVIPDQLVLDLSQPAGFPNGRDLDDPVVDLELAVLFLDLARHSAGLLASLPVNPNNFDQPLRTTFPFFAPALGTRAVPSSVGSNFNFRTDPEANYVRVDRMGVPAVATVTILSPRKNAYNDSSPAADAAGANANDVVAGYQVFTNALNDDFRGLGLTPCAN